MTSAAPTEPLLTLVEMAAVSPVEAAEIAELTAAATVADGVSPVNDQVRGELSFGAAPGARHVLGRAAAGPEVVAYAHVTPYLEGASGHLVVHPEHRRRGLGGTLTDHLLGRLEPGPADPTLRIWAHGDTPGARALAASRQFTRARDLLQMRRNLAPALPAPSYPPEVTVRAFQPGRDDDAWISLNAAAFAAHPEQGRLTVGDLRHRMAEPWFDPAGFFLAERDGALLGSHWTKVHPADEATGEGSIGEVYAIGVHPAAQGLGLGKALTLTGLHHLRGRGLAEVMLYVEGDNASALALYRRLEFETTTVDVMYARRR